MSDTPETDALDCELHTPRVLQDRYSEMRDHAQKLERERDEARRECKFLWDERDEAREQANYWKSQYELEKGLYVIELK